MARILIVDDEPAILQTFKLVLESAGYEVTTADSATDAKQKLADQKFDVVITDVRMETSTAGFDVVRAAHQTSPATPVALLTAFPLPTADWKRAGADAFFNKGFNVREMLDWIRARLGAANSNINKSSDRVEKAKRHAS
jgi:two-component system response regulator GlrR